MAAKSFHDMIADKMSGAPDDGGADAADDGGDPDYGEAYKAAVQNFIDAVSSKDADAAADALKSAITLCGKAGDDEEEGDSGGGHSALLLIPHGPKGK